MAEKAIILIPDISGFTEFTSATELDHSSHIISELLDLIIASNDQDFTLAEIEGDAVLFYRKGDPLSKRMLVEQCLRMFENFHKRLKVIDRDTVCECGACQSAINLTLKFIAHYGDIKEIRVAQFTKATGIDMIVAHRLLKNMIDSHEYILITSNCLTNLPELEGSPELPWKMSRENYPSIGDVDFEYAVLTGLRDALPDPPERERFVVIKGNDTLEIDFDRPLLEVYQTLINVDERLEWIVGIDKINRDPVTERIGMMHNCKFQGLLMENTCVHAEFRGDSAIYVEQVTINEMSLDSYDIYELVERDGRTHLELNFNWLDTQLTPETIAAILHGVSANLEALKAFCESKPASVDA